MILVPRRLPDTSRPNPHSHSGARGQSPCANLMGARSRFHLLRPILKLSLLALALLIPAFSSDAITILGGASLTKSTTAPLSARLNRGTYVPSRVSVSMTNGSGSWTRHFYVCNPFLSSPFPLSWQGSVRRKRRFRDTISSTRYSIPRQEGGRWLRIEAS